MKACAIPNVCTYSGCTNKRFTRLHCSGHHKQLQQGRPLTPFRTINDHVEYSGAHSRIKYLWGPAKQYPCVTCGKQSSNWAYDGTDPEQLFGSNGVGYSIYSRYPEFYKPMCWSCHSAEDRANLTNEVVEYRTWKQRTGLTLADIPVWLIDIVRIQKEKI